MFQEDAFRVSKYIQCWVLNNVDLLSPHNRRSLIFNSFFNYISEITLDLTLANARMNANIVELNLD